MSKPTATTIALLGLSLTATATQEEGVRNLDQAAGIQSIKVNSAARSLEVQKLGLSGQGVTVAIIDTGIDATHADLAGAVIDEACFTANRGCPNGASQQFGAGAARDDHGHGTQLFASGAAITDGRNGRVPPRIDTRAALTALQMN